MDDGTLGRLQRDVEDIVVRLRAVESFDTRAGREVLQDIRDLQAEFLRIDQKGSTAVVKDIEAVRVTLQRHERELGMKANDDVVKDLAIIAKAKADAVLVQEMRDDTKSNRRIVLAAVVGTAFSIGAWLIQWLISRSP